MKFIEKVNPLYVFVAIAILVPVAFAVYLTFVK